MDCKQYPTSNQNGFYISSLNKRLENYRYDLCEWFREKGLERPLEVGKPAGWLLQLTKQVMKVAWMGWWPCSWVDMNDPDRTGWWPRDENEREGNMRMILGWDQGHQWKHPPEFVSNSGSSNHVGLHIDLLRTTLIPEGHWKKAKCVSFSWLSSLKKLKFFLFLHRL
jgi:hypothetical protein